MRMSHIVICDLPRSTKFFLVISQMARLKKKKVTDYEKFILIFSTKFVWNISHYKKKWARYDKISILVFMYLYLSDFNETWIFSTDFRKIFKYQISWKSV